MGKKEDFIPAYDEFHSFQERGRGSVYLTLFRGEEIAYPFLLRVTEDFEESYFYLKKILLTMLWLVGGDRFEFACEKSFYVRAKERIEKDKEILPSLEAMKKIYGRSVRLAFSRRLTPKKVEASRVALSNEGSRIGLDLGGSDIKVVALENGEVVFSKEIPWSPKKAKDSSYHETYIHKALLEASSHLKSVGSVGVSTSGAVLGNELVHPSLFASCAEKEKKTKARALIHNIIESLFPDVPYYIVNDGDASALGALDCLEGESVLGLSLGTSLAAGYVEDGCLCPYLNELSKAPINFSPSARKHYEFDIRGAASEYLSQKGIVSLAENEGIALTGSLPKKLLQIQNLADQGNNEVLRAYDELGKRLAGSATYFSMFLDFDCVYLLGRVMSGKGGERILLSANEAMKEIGRGIRFYSASEKAKRLGQAYVAARLE